MIYQLSVISRELPALGCQPRGTWKQEPIRQALFRAGEGEAFDDDTGGLEMGDSVVGAVAHEDGLAEEGDQWAGVVGEEAAGGLFEVDDEVVGDIAFGTEDGRLQRAVEGGYGEFADGFGAGTDGCDGQGHCFVGYHRGFRFGLCVG
jgi:hypothetical protein